MTEVHRKSANVLFQSGQLRYLDGRPGSSAPRGSFSNVKASKGVWDAGEECVGEGEGLKKLLGGRITAWGWGLVVKALRGPHYCLRDMAGVVGLGTGPPKGVGGPGAPTGGGGGAGVSAGGACSGAHSCILTMLKTKHKMEVRNALYKQKAIEQ